MALAKCFAQKGTLENLIFKTGLFNEFVILQELTGYIYITLSAGSVWEHSFKLQDGSVKKYLPFFNTTFCESSKRQTCCWFPSVLFTVSSKGSLIEKSVKISIIYSSI